MNSSSLRSTLLSPELGDLPFSEKLLLWGMRIWVRSQMEGVNINQTLEHGFKLAGMPGVFPVLDELLTIIHHSASAPVDIRDPHFPDLSPDENLLLGAVAYWQHPELFLGMPNLLSELLPATACRCAQAPLKTIADSFGSRGLIVRPRLFRDEKQMAQSHNHPTSTAIH